jgi:Zn-dependent M28 family amino/carboxypeptidase
MVGAHLDSVLDGPGINDNGSGVVAAIEIGRALAAEGVPEGWALRIGLWGAEEYGSIGSRAYAEGIGDEVVAYLNLDMAGSVNGATLVYDEADAAPGSARITDVFESVLVELGEPSERVDLGGSSDHFGFIQAGVPTGGLFAGASESGGAAQPSTGGGGPAPDPCYHIGCDDLDNVDVERVALFAEVTAEVIRRLMDG